jgi:hypothetical protein
MPRHLIPILDKQIRTALSCDIRKRDITATIIDEVPLLRNGRADVAAINGVLSGYEIKSERDSLARLPIQIPMYEAVFDYCSIVVAKRHLRRVRASVPNSWGICVATERDGELLIEQRRKAKVNRGVQRTAIIQLLWKPELARLLREHNVTYEGTSLRALWRAAEQLPRYDSMRRTACADI